MHANNKGAYQPVHLCSLISAFVVHCLDCIILLDSISEISSLYLASMAAQAGLSLTWSKLPKTGFLVMRLKFNTVLLLQDAEYTTSIFVRQFGTNVEPYQYLGRYRAHYKPIKEIMFGIQLDDDSPRLMSLGQDRVLVRFR